MELKLTSLHDEQKRQIRKKKRRRTVVIIGAIILFCIIAQFVIDNTIGRFENIYDAIAFNNDFDKEDIIDIVYGDTSAMVIYERPTGVGMRSYYFNNNLWVNSGFKGQSVDFQKCNIIIYKMRKGNDWCILIIVRAKKNEADIDDIVDQYGTEFFNDSSDELSRSYFAYFHPESENYEISINGETYQIKLKHFKD